MSRLYGFFFGTLRRQLIIGVAAVHAIMMTLFVWDLVANQRAFILERQAEQAMYLGRSLATSSAGWLSSHDISGLQELAEAQQRYPELRFAMLLDTQGRVLAHTDRSRLGLYVRDLPSEIRARELNRSLELVDVLVPVKLVNRHVGWARVGIGQRLAVRKLNAITRNGVLYAMMAIAVGSLLAWLMARQITRRLYAIQAVMDQVRSGDRQVRCRASGSDEAAVMAHEFNRMLDMLAQREEALLRSGEALLDRERLFRSLSQISPVGIFRTDQAGDYLYVNERWRGIVGLSEDEARGEGWARGLFPEDRARVVEAWRDAVRYARPCNIEYRYQRPDGSIRWVMGQSVVERGVRGEVSGHVGTITDITERKLAELELRRLNDELEQRVLERTGELAQKNREMEHAYTRLKETQEQILQQEKMASVGQLAAGVAHEINNPMGFIASNLGSLARYLERLTAFIGALEARLGGQQDEELAALRRKLKIDYIMADSRQLVAESLEGADRVKKIVQGLKNFSRADQAERLVADINACLDSTLDIVWNELKYKCDVKKEYGTLPLTVCNPQQLNQVFVNLLVNAAQAIERRGEIRIKTWADSDRIHVSVADNGCGIPRESIKRIFEPFYTTKEVGKGTGLGLSIAYDIVVKNHKGDIEVESEEGRGTTFTVSIPLVAAEPA
ncbi:MAG: ATP-binding protein [Thermodesulfobacteriota bacterium]